MARSSSSKSPANKANNTSLEIDFSNSKTQQELALEQATTRGVWVNKLHALLAGVEGGKGEVDTFYKIGDFGTPSGARTAVREITKKADVLPAVFSLEPRVFANADGKRVSELWAAVLSSDAAEAAEGVTA